MRNIIGNIKNKELFVVSDIHGCYTALTEALNKRGFDVHNPNHMLIIDGDLFDRGNENVELYKYIKSIPPKQLFLIRGNHEDMFVGLAKKELPDVYDFHNGTVRTFCDFAGLDKYIFDSKSWNSVKKKILKSEIYHFMLSDVWNDYCEVGRFIITHGFIPSKKTMTGNIYDPLWRHSDSVSWNEARWCNGPLWISSGIVKSEIKHGETFVLGHVETQYFPDILGYAPIRASEDDIYYGKGVIGLDASSYLSGKVNVLKLKVVDSTNVTIEYEDGYQ